MVPLLAAFALAAGPAKTRGDVEAYHNGAGRGLDVTGSKLKKL